MKHKTLFPPKNYKEIPFGFEYGSAKVTRLLANRKSGFVIVAVETPKHKQNDFLQIYVTKTGKVRVFDKSGEWTPPINKEQL